VRGQRKFDVIIINKTPFLVQHPDKEAICSASDDDKVSKPRAVKRQSKPAALQEISSDDDEDFTLSKRPRRHTAKKLLRIESSTSESEDEPKERLRRNHTNTVPKAGSVAVDFFFFFFCFLLLQRPW
jgi:hypothetical protein